MLHTILTIVGLVIMAIIAIAAFSIIGILTDKERDSNTNLLFSKLDKTNLYLQNLRDRHNTIPTAQDIGAWMQSREKNAAQLLASIEGSRETLTAISTQLATLVEKSGYADFLPKIDETLRAMDGQLQNIADFADCGRKDLAVLKDLAEEQSLPAEQQKDPIVDTPDKPADASPADEAADTDGLTQEQANAVSGVADKYVTVNEKYERMKQRRAEGADWKVLAREFGYTCPRNARRFFTQQAKKEKATQE